MIYSSGVPDFKMFPLEIVGDPKQISDPFYVGHMSNDSCKMTNLSQAEVYEKVGLASCNGGIGLVPYEANWNEELFEALGLWCSKPIKAGEEILGHYGVAYWKYVIENGEKFDINAMD